MTRRTNRVESVEDIGDETGRGNDFCDGSSLLTCSVGRNQTVLASPPGSLGKTFDDSQARRLGLEEVRDKWCRRAHHPRVAEGHKRGASASGGGPLQPNDDEGRRSSATLVYS
jgi:hypothetical protein